MLVIVGNTIETWDVPQGLRCEMRRHPLGVQARRPRFSWQLPAGTRRNQVSYQIQVATTPAALATNKPDMWDTGQVCSADSLHVPYGGEPLAAGTLYWWRVRLWSTAGEITQFSPPARLATGLWDTWQAQWIWVNTTCQNQHVLLRKTMVAPVKPVQSVLAFVSADDYYKLYANGTVAGQGPSPSYPHLAHNYNTIDLTPLWQPGKPFCLAAHAYYQGLCNYVWVSGDALSGFIMEVRVAFADGESLSIITDQTWRTLHCQAYVAGHTMGYGTAFSENIDARLLPLDWQLPGFDDTSWSSATIISPGPWRLHAQETEMLALEEVCPQEVEFTADGRLFFDMGREVAGTLRVDLCGRSGDQIEVRLGEELLAPQVVRCDMRCNCLYKDVWTLRDGPQSLELYDYRGFRYGELHGVAQAHPSIAVLVRHYPFEEAASHFACADSRLNALWNLGKYTTKVGTQEGYLDCPTREKGAYSLDTYLEMASAFYHAGEWNLGRRAVEYLLQSSTDGKARCLAPAGKDHFFTEYTMYPVLMAWFYYTYTADSDFLMRNYASLALIEAYMRQHFLGDDGLLHDTDPVLQDLVDWPKNRRDGHEMLPVNTVVNAVYYRLLTLMARIATVAGHHEEAAGYRQLANSVAAAFETHLWDEAQKRYVDGIDSSGRRSAHASLHANAFPLAMGVVPPECVPHVLALIETRGFRCNLFLAQFLLEALYDHGAADYAQDLLLASGPDSPLQMVRQGATTTWEAWDLDQKWNTSLFHPAGAFTGYIIGSRIMGVTPLEPGFARIRIKPQVGPLTWGHIRVPTLRGPVVVSFRQRPGKCFRLELWIPGNTSAQVLLPMPPERRWSLRVDGENRPYRIVNGAALSDDVGAGYHVLELMPAS